MNYEGELRLLREALKKCHVRTVIVSPLDAVSSAIDTELTSIFKSNIDLSVSVRKYFKKIEPRVMYKVTDDFRLCYIFFYLPPSNEQKILFIGPYLSSSVSSTELLELGERLGISPHSQRYLKEYYLSIPVIPECDRLFMLLYSFFESIYGTESFLISDVNVKEILPASPINELSKSENSDDILVNMAAIKRRYSFENELIKAVSLGQIQKETVLNSAFNEYSFEKRVADPVRNLKNYGIIMNTLLRKAAEQGGVHPLYIDKVSSGFAEKIERISSVDDVPILMGDMFRSYCRLVRKHSMQKYSPIVQKTILIIDSDLSATLSLSSLAKRQDISSGYLSSVFKKEVGKTISEYIREKRINHAKHLLQTTHLQIQTIAIHCGILDMQYFSKIFKKEIGQTPKEYRDSMFKN